MNKKIHKINYILIAYTILIPVMFILPYFSVKEYSIIKNTTSHLGAQSTPNAWIMNIVFFLLGITSIIETGLYLKEYWFQKILIIIFGLGLLGTGVFNHAPVIEGIPYNSLEDSIHSVMASIVGASFILFTFSTTFIVTTNKRRIIAVLTGVTLTVLSILMFALAEFAGLWQRLIFIISFGWLILFIKGIKRRV